MKRLLPVVAALGLAAGTLAVGTLAAGTNVLAQIVAPGAGSAAIASANDTPVKRVGPQRLTVSTPTGQGALAVFLSADWDHPLPRVNRAVVVAHGIRRNADAYLAAAQQVREAAGVADETVLLVAPQFLNQADTGAFGLPATDLRWQADAWTGGQSAIGPAPLSSFDGFDAILARLADKRLFPALRHVVVAGHSGGAQIVQRYAVVGRGEAALAQTGVAVRYVVANPSSYIWFGDLRPRSVTCREALQWKYGLQGAPPYVGPTGELERQYINRDVIYLLGEADRDPNHPVLDKSCAAEAQGENRLARGMLFDLFLEQRHPNLVRHRIYSIPGIGHDQRAMFASTCGKAALFDQPGCQGI